MLRFKYEYDKPVAPTRSLGLAAGVNAKRWPTASSIAIEIGRSGFHEALASGGASGVVHPGCGGGAGPFPALSPPPARRPGTPPLRRETDGAEASGQEGSSQRVPPHVCLPQPARAVVGGACGVAGKRKGITGLLPQPA